MSDEVGTEERQMGELIAATTELTEAVSMVAIGLAKITERCFCGHRLDLHAENVGPCSVANCDFKCQFFIPVHLAIARIFHNTFIQIIGINQALHGAVGAAQDQGAIVKPFTH